MGITYITGRVTGPTGKATVPFLVDRRATYMLLPYDVWQEVDLALRRSMTFTQADGALVER